MNKYICLFILSCFAFSAGLYRPHILRTMRGEMGLAEIVPVVEDSLQPNLWYDPDTIKVPGLKSFSTAMLLNLGFTLGPLFIAAPWGMGYVLPVCVPSLSLGPSSGLFYTHKLGRGCVSSIIRFGLLVIAAYSISAMNTIDYQLHPISDIALLASIGSYCFTVVNDGLAAKKSVEQYNTHLRLEFFQKFEQEHQKVGLGISFSF